MDDVANFLHNECERVMGAEGGSYTMEPVAVYGLALSEILALRIQVTSQAKQLKAADALAKEVEYLGLRQLVAGWNGEGKEVRHDPHPARTKATIPTRCGHVYAIDAALLTYRKARRGD